MKKLHAELTVLYTKLHTLHYNVTGEQFYPIHKMSEGYYEFVHKMIDEVAESIIMDNKKPYSTMSECIQVAKIKEIKSIDYSSKEVLSILLEDFEYLLEYVIAEVETNILNQNGQNALDEIRAKLEKEVWMIKATLKKKN